MKDVVAFAGNGEVGLDVGVDDGLNRGLIRESRSKVPLIVIVALRRLLM